MTQFDRKLSHHKSSWSTHTFPLPTKRLSYVFLLKSPVCVESRRSTMRKHKSIYVGTDAFLESPLVFVDDVFPSLVNSTSPSALWVHPFLFPSLGQVTVLNPLFVSYRPSVEGL